MHSCEKELRSPKSLKMKIDTKVIPLDTLISNLLLKEDKHPSDYVIGLNLFVDGFFSGVELFDILDGGEIPTLTCSEHALQHVERYRKTHSLADESSFFKGSFDACQKTYQMLDLAYSNIEAA
jgi:hypothetical protein